jgi:DeoR/GlpR family transcriptional regulator of sugar metabolism
VADLADQSGGFTTDTELADLAGWSETTARRYRNLAEEQGVIHRNGDGRYHPIP